jgi:nitrite reductase (NADH) small subunit
MPQLTRLCAASDLPQEGEAREFSVGEKVVCVANVGGTISAMDNVCLHRGGPIGQGFVNEGKVVCPWHGWEWNPQTGAAAHNPAARVPVYPIKVEGNDVLVEI